MSANQLYFPQSALVEAATLTDIAGTAANRANWLDNRRQTNATIIADVGTGEYSLKIDLGAGNTLAPTFIGFVDAAYFLAATWVLYNGTDGTTWSTVPGASAILSSGNLVTTFSAPTARRYYKLRIGVGGGSIIDGTSRFAELVMGTTVTTTVDPNYGQPIQRDYSGTTVNTTSGGNRFTVQRYGTRIIRSVYYESITTADKNLLLALELDRGNALKPFLFAVEEGGAVTYQYGRLMQGMEVTEAGAGLWNVGFMIEEEIA